MKRRFDIIGLIIANVITMYMAVRYSWDPGRILFIYWAQSVMIGFFNFFKILNFHYGNKPTESLHPGLVMINLLVAMLFVVHYGFFHAIYLFFIIHEFAGAGDIVNNLPTLVIPLAGFFLNHWYSYKTNYEQELALTPNINNMMGKPYARIVPMHLTIIFGGMILTANGSGTLVILLFMTIKTIADIYSHDREHGIKLSDYWAQTD